MKRRPAGQQNNSGPRSSSVALQNSSSARMQRNSAHPSGKGPSSVARLNNSARTSENNKLTSSAH
jgi:hypothetical protein